jgi:hypothetical protein
VTILGKLIPNEDQVRPKDYERILAGALLEELRDQNRTTTARAAKVQSQVVNGVLEVATAVLSANDGTGVSGTISRTYHATIGSLVVINNTTADLIVSSASPSAIAPTAGDGVFIVPAGVPQAIVPIGSRQFTLYGLLGKSVSFVAWTGLQPYGSVG